MYVAHCSTIYRDKKWQKNYCKAVRSIECPSKTLLKIATSTAQSVHQLRQLWLWPSTDCAWQQQFARLRTWVWISDCNLFDLESTVTKSDWKSANQTSQELSAQSIQPEKNNSSASALLRSVLCIFSIFHLLGLVGSTWFDQLDFSSTIKMLKAIVICVNF